MKERATATLAVQRNMSEVVMEKTLLVKQESFVFKIPAGQTGTSGWKANSWQLDKPEWCGRLRLVSSGTGGKECIIRLEEKGVGNKLYAQCPVDAYPGSAVETVSDSSR